LQLQNVAHNTYCTQQNNQCLSCKPSATTPDCWGMGQAWPGHNW